MTEDFIKLTFTELVAEWERELEELPQRMRERIQGVSEDSEPDMDLLTRVSTTLAIEIGALHRRVLDLAEVIRVLAAHTGLEAIAVSEVTPGEGGSGR